NIGGKVSSPSTLSSSRMEKLLRTNATFIFTSITTPRFTRPLTQEHSRTNFSFKEPPLLDYGKTLDHCSGLRRFRPANQMAGNLRNSMHRRVAKTQSVWLRG